MVNIPAWFSNTPKLPLPVKVLTSSPALFKKLGSSKSPVFLALVTKLLNISNLYLLLKPVYALAEALTNLPMIGIFSASCDWNGSSLKANSPGLTSVNWTPASLANL